MSLAQPVRLEGYQSLCTLSGAPGHFFGGPSPQKQDPENEKTSSFLQSFNQASPGMRPVPEEPGQSPNPGYIPSLAAPTRG